MSTKITHHEVHDNVIEFFGPDSTVKISAELDSDSNKWVVSNCETGASNVIDATENPVADAYGIIAAVLGSVNGGAKV